MAHPSSNGGQQRRCRVSVLGLSGKQKGQVGVGKSCLCNRFMSSSAANYREDHTSQLNNIDFLGPVINHDHFLYWGRAERTSAGGRNTVFEIVEQTEFEDENFQQFSRAGELTTYLRAAASIKLLSAGKIAYMHKEQLSLPSDYEQVPFPDRFYIDGFLVAVDVSQQRAAIQPNTQDTLLGRLLPTLAKMKRPVVVAATKCDDLRPTSLDTLEALVHKHLKSAPIVCTSARKAINVADAFFALDQLVERRGAHVKFVPYEEAVRQRQAEVDELVRQFSDLLKLKAIDFRETWNAVRLRLSSETAYRKLVDFEGMKEARRLSLRHLKQLREERKAVVAEAYANRLKDAFDALLLRDASLLSDWKSARCQIRCSSRYEDWFEKNTSNCWDDEFLENYDDKLLPDDLLDDDLARDAFESRMCKIIQDRDEQIASEILRSLLEAEKDRLLPGADWQAAKLTLQNNPRYNKVVLSDALAQQTYREFQQQLQEECRKEFYELVLENVALFGSSTTAQGTSANTALIKKVENELRGQKAFERLRNRPDERSFVILKVLALRQRPPLCETIWNYIAQLPCQSDWLSAESRWSLFSPHKPVTISIMGLGQLGHQLERQLWDLTCDDKLTLPNGGSYSLNLRVASSGRDLSTADFLPQGIIGVVSSKQSALYLRQHWKGILLAEQDRNVQRAATGAGKLLPLRGIPIVILCVCRNEFDHETARECGEGLATDVQCPVVWSESTGSTHLISPLQALEAFSQLVHVMKHRRVILGHDSKPPAYVSIAMCCLHDDLLIAERILGPLLSHQCCFRPTHGHNDERRTFYIDVCVDNSLQLVQFTLYSSLNADVIRRDPHHGFIIVQDSERRASTAVAKFLMERLPEQVPRILVIQMSDDKDKHTVTSEGIDVVLDFGAAMLPATSSFQFEGAAFNQFFRTVCKQRYSSLQEQGIATPTSRRRTSAPLPPTPDILDRDDCKRANAHSEKLPVTRPRKIMTSKLSESEIVGKRLNMRSMSEDNILSLFDEEGSLRPPATESTPSAATSGTEDESPTQNSTERNKNAYSFIAPSGEVHIYDNRLGRFGQHRKAQRRAFSESLDAEPANGQPASGLSRSSAGIGYSSVTRGMCGGQRMEGQSLRGAGLTRSEAIRWPDPHPVVRQASPCPPQPTWKSLHHRSSVSELIEHFSQSDSSNDSSPLLPRKEQPAGKRHLGRQVRIASQPFEQERPCSPNSGTKTPVRAPSPPPKLRIATRTSEGSLVTPRAVRPPLVHQSRSVDSTSSNCPLLAADLNNDSLAPEKENEQGASANHSYAKVRLTHKQPRRTRDHVYEQIPAILHTGPSFVDNDDNNDRQLPLRSSRGSPIMRSLKKSLRHSVMGDPVKRHSGSSDDQALRASPLSEDSDDSNEGPQLPRRGYLDVSDTDEERLSDTENDFLSSKKGSQHGQNAAPQLESVMLRRQQTIRLHEELQSKVFWKRETKEKRLEQKRAKKEKKRLEKAAKARRKAKLLSPSRALPKPIVKDIVGKDYFGLALHDLPSPDNSGVPRFVRLCTEYIEEHGLDNVGVYRLSGLKRVVEQLLEDFAKDPNAGLAVDDVPRVNAVASAFKAFFRELPEPLVPTAIIPQFVACLHEEEEESQLVQLRELIVHGLPNHNRIILQYLCEHLYRVSQHSETNKMVPQNLSVVFCVNIMWPRDTSDEKLAAIFPDHSATIVQELPQLLERVLTLLISRCSDIFPPTAENGSSIPDGKSYGAPAIVEDDDDIHAPYSSVKIQAW